MKSNKQRRKEIKDRRIARTKAIRAEYARINGLVDVYTLPDSLPASVVKSNLHELAHNNTYDRLPLFYVDKDVVCRVCWAHEVWKAKQ